MKNAPSELPARDTYRHGDLRRVLIEAGVALARAGGPEAVALREVTRQAGVVPNAAYRHFANRDALLSAVRSAALTELADSMETHLAGQPAAADPADQARAALRAIGFGYLAFAAAQPGLFRTAFCITDRPTEPQEGRSSAGGLDPYQLLGRSLDGMVAAGLLPVERRPDAEFLAWSAVHGLAMLLNEGPLSRLPLAKRGDVGDQLVAMVERGL